MVLLTIIDITERKLTERSLKESVATARTLLNIPTAAAFLLDREGVCLDADKTLAARFSKSISEIIGKPIWDLFPKELAERRKARFLEILRDKKQGRFEDEREGMWNDSILSPVLDEDGVVSKVAVFCFDVTERKRMEEALRESEERLRTLINSTPDIVCFKDGEGRWLEANDADLELFQLKGLDHRGKKDSELAEFSEFYHDVFLSCEQTDEEAWQKGTPVRGEEAIPRPDGTVKTFDVIKVPLFHNDGNRKGLVVLGRDISERKEAEEKTRKMESQLRQAQKLEAIGTLAGGIAHDFNNLLSPIIGYTEMALHELPNSDPIKADLEQVAKAALRAKDLVTQILSFSRYGRDQQRIPVDLSPIIKEALKLLRASLPATIEIQENIEKSMALADATQIHQVVINLCTNAYHAMDGSGTLEISLLGVDLATSDLVSLSIWDLEPGRFLKLRVKDTGCGMASEIMGCIFDPYFTTKAVGKGSGLGLAVVHGIVKRHEGAIHVQSAEGKGSTFDIYIPSIITKEEALTDKSSLLPTGTERVLFIDDEQMVIDLGTRILERLGYRVTSTADGLYALDLFRSKPDEFDLIVTDYTMPHLTGIDLAKEILRIRPGMPIILCTGFTEKVTERIAKDIGIMEFAMKPLEVRRLACLVRKTLDAGKDCKDTTRRRQP